MIPNVTAHVLICYVTFQLLVMLMEQFHIFSFDVFTFMAKCMYCPQLPGHTDCTMFCCHHQASTGNKISKKDLGLKFLAMQPLQKECKLVWNETKMKAIRDYKVSFGL